MFKVLIYIFFLLSSGTPEMGLYKMTQTIKSNEQLEHKKIFVMQMPERNIKILGQ